MAAAVSGTLNEKDMERLIKAARAGSVGPTAVYYAGVTAPAISAGVAFITHRALAGAGLSNYWVTLWSAILAAMTGISWYLIFVRWSSRQQAGRASDLEGEIGVTVGDDALVVKRGHVETRIGWRAVDRVETQGGHTLIFVERGEPVIIPDAWFSGDAAALGAFRDALTARIG